MFRRRHSAGATWIVLLLTLCVVSCAKNEFKIEFALSQDTVRTYTMLYYASDPKKGWNTEVTVVLNGGRGEAMGITRNPTLVYVLGGNREPVALFYAERGDKIRISGDGDPLSWKIEGNKIDEGLSEWVSRNASLIRDARSGGGPQKMTLNRAIGKFVRDHRGDPVSALLLIGYYDRGADDAGFARLWDSLEGKAADGVWAEMSGRADLISGMTAVPEGFPRRLKLRTNSGSGYDTVSTGRAPMLLYFSRNTVEGYRNDVLKLRRMIRERGDSSSKTIVVVRMEPDSSTWRYSLTIDSLHGAVNAWMPLGVSDSTARALGVRSLPWVIAVGKDGKIKYKGERIEDADQSL